MPDPGWAMTEGGRKLTIVTATAVNKVTIRLLAAFFISLLSFELLDERLPNRHHILLRRIEPPNGKSDAAARFKSAIGNWKSAMTWLPPLASNDLLCAPKTNLGKSDQGHPSQR